MFAYYILPVIPIQTVTGFTRHVLCVLRVLFKNHYFSVSINYVIITTSMWLAVSHMILVPLFCPYSEEETELKVNKG